MMRLSDRRGADYRPWLWGAFALGAAGCAVASTVSPGAFFAAYLTAILWPWGLSMGALTLILIFALTGGRWAEVAWPWLVSQAGLMPFVALLFVPYLAGLNHLYSWTDPATFSGREHVSHRQWYYIEPFFIVRTIGYFLVWSLLALLAAGGPFRRIAPRPLEANTVPVIFGGQATAGLGLVAILLTVTWAVMDWVMSFDPFFVSTLLGVLVGMGGVLSALAFAVVGVACFQSPAQSHGDDSRSALAHLSNLLLAFVMLWAYFSFAHLLIIWSGDLPVEARFYLSRTAGPWRFISWTLAVGGLFVPFACLLMHDFKRSATKMAALATLIVLIRFVELSWFVLPGASDGAGRFNWAVVPAVAAVTSGWLLALSYRMAPAAPSGHGEKADA